MRAVVVRPSPWRRRLARTVGELTTSARWGRLSGLALRDLPSPPLPGPSWVRLRVRMAGIGVDELRALAGRASPLREPFSSWPAVPGREIMGEVVEAGSEVTVVEPGARVVVDPFLPCAARGFGERPCAACARGWTALCGRAGEEGELRVYGRPLRRGDRLGRHADLPGGWGEEVVAHEAQLIAVDPALPSRVAALVEPLAAALHAVRLALPGGSAGDRPGLVLGHGVRALATAAALRALDPPRAVTLFAGTEVAAALAGRMGVESVVRTPEELRDAMAGTGARASMPLRGEEVWADGGFDPVFEWSGTGEGLDRALRLAGPAATVVLAGAAVEPAEGLLEHAAARGVVVVGAVGYGPRPPHGPDASTLPVAHEILRKEPRRWEGLVTHVYPLAQHREALDVASGRGREEAVKVLLDPGA